MKERDKIRYETLFYCQKLEDGFLSGDIARALFIRSKLPFLDLTRIWKLSDGTRDNKLDVFEFSLAMHFIEIKMMGGEIPEHSDVQNAESNKEVSIQKISLKEKQQIKDIFELADTNSQGFVELNVVKPMMFTSGLPLSTLSRIWNIADLDRDGKLCLLEFTIAMHLLKSCVKGVNLNGPVNPFACFFDEDDAIRVYKEKLATFDKEFLRSQNEEEPFLNSSDSADNADFELLTCYLFDGGCVLSQGEREPGFVDENRNIFHKTEEKVVYSYNPHEDNVLDDSQDGDSLAVDESHLHSTETIQSDKIKSSWNIDLDSIFESFRQENIDESEQAPKFIPNLAVGFTETKNDEEEEEEKDVLPYFQRRRYFGKDLVFEDPVGSETIGDVEFEVDFDEIIRDIEKKALDEERRLPIARVLPIYRPKSPVTDEQPFERTVTTKVNREIDLGLIEVNTGEVFDLEKNSRERKTNNTVAKESKTSDKEIIANEESTTGKADKNKNSHVNNTKNIDNVSINDTIDDIVEQKRLLFQSQQEERKKLRENRQQRNESKDQQSELTNSLPVVAKSEQINFHKNTDYENQEKGTNIQSTLNNSNCSGAQRKDDRSVFERDAFIEDKTWESEQGRNEHIKRVNPMPKNTDITTKLNENEESQSEDEEEVKRIREAEKKERLLLERIKYLEKRRQQLYEKKQRELKSNEVYRKEKEKAYSSTHGEEKSDRVNVNPKGTQEKYEGQNITSSTSPDPWSSHFKQNGIENEEEKRKLTEALALKRKNEAELERKREEVLRAAEKRRLEEEAKKQQELEEAKERKRTFRENLKRLKQLVLTEEQEKDGALNSQTNREPSAGTSELESTSEKTSLNLVSFNKSQTTSRDTSKRSDTTEGKDFSNAMEKNVRLEANRSRSEAVVERRQSASNEVYSSTVQNDKTQIETEEEQREYEEMRTKFKSNRELFMRKVESEAKENAQVQKREKKRNARPKSFYGGMFNKPVHKIIDDSLLAENVDSSSAGDLVDQEALKQFQREQELRKEHEKVNKLRHNLERESSYTVENVEQLFTEADSESKKEAAREWDDLERNKAKSSSHAHRRSLVNTLTTEWNSFLDVLEEDKRRESETVKMRQGLSAQRKPSPARSSKTVNTPVDVVKSNSSNKIVEEKEIFAKQAGKVKNLVTPYKRLSLPCFPLDQDEAWIKKSDDETQPGHSEAKIQGGMSNLRRQERNGKSLDSKTVIKENAPKRKTDLAHAWSNMISNQQKTD